MELIHFLRLKNTLHLVKTTDWKLDDSVIEIPESAEKLLKE